MGEPDGGMRTGQSVCFDPPKKGFAFDVGLLVGGYAALYSASKAGDGISWPAAWAGEPANACLKQNVLGPQPGGPGEVGGTRLRG